jgi:hypothetical protein
LAREGDPGLGDLGADDCLSIEVSEAISLGVRVEPSFGVFDRISAQAAAGLGFFQQRDQRLSQCARIGDGDDQTGCFRHDHRP